jgi:hypothetical protein
MASGLWSSWNGGSKGWGPSTHASTHPTSATTRPLAHHRQRGEGSDPVGVSSGMKPRQRGSRMKLACANTAA